MEKIDRKKVFTKDDIKKIKNAYVELLKAKSACEHMRAILDELDVKNQKYKEALRDIQSVNNYAPVPKPTENTLEQTSNMIKE